MNKDYQIISDTIKKNQPKESLDSDEEVKMSSIFQNQFKTYSVLGALLSVAMYSLFNIISESSTYISYYLTYGEVLIEKSQILTSLINIALFLIAIIILMYSPSINKKNILTIITILTGLATGGIFYLIRKSNATYLNSSEFSFLIFGIFIPFVLYYLYSLNNVHEKTWLFKFGLYFLSLFSIFLIIDMNKFSVFIDLIKENVFLMIIYGIQNISLFIYLYLIQNPQILQKNTKRNGKYTFFMVKKSAIKSNLK